jgi:putative spermidine/putrescine transport system substrate-binding protein
MLRLGTFITGLMLMGAVALGASWTPAAAQPADDVERFRAEFLAGRLSWADVTARARKEGRVNFYHWGGSDDLNVWVDSVARPEIREQGVALQARRVAGTREAVDLVIAETRAGRGLGRGSVDVVWLNGENFFTLKQQGRLFGAFAKLLPNSRNFEWDAADPRAQLNLRDFGVDTELAELPWSGQQYVCAVNRALMRKEDTPSTFPDLLAYLTRNPGKFTYVKPPQFVGNTFVQAAMYAFNPDGTGAAPFQKSRQELGAAEIARLIKPGMEFLQRLEPLLLGGAPGRMAQHPASAQAAQALFRNREIHMTCAFGLYAVATLRDSGAYPDTAEEIIFPVRTMIKNKNYLAIPSNAPNPAAALVFINHMASVDSQVSRLKLLGSPPGIDIWRLSPADAQKLQAVEPPHFGVTAAELDANIAPDTNASLIDVIKGVWIELIERGSTRPIEEIVANVIAGLK